MLLANLETNARRTLVFFVLVSGTAASNTVWAFDCKNAFTQTEKKICSDPVLQKLDAQLNRDYKIFRQTYGKSGTHECLLEDEAQAQKSWLQQRDACGTDKKCIEDAYRSRINQLDTYAHMCMGDDFSPIYKDRPCHKSAAGTGATPSAPTASAGSQRPEPGKCTDSVASIPEEVVGMIFPRASAELVSTLAREINNILLSQSYKSQFNSKQKLASFFGQVSVESGGGTSLVESLNYSAEALPKLFSYFRNHPDEATRYGRTKDHPANQEAIANRAYANRNGNGGIASSDGWNYRGGGLLQVTGRGNYKSAANRVNAIYSEKVDFVYNPELLRKPLYATRSAISYWVNRNIGGIVGQMVDQKKSIEQINDKVTSLVNGAAKHALAQRLAETKRILALPFFKLCENVAAIFDSFFGFISGGAHHV